MKNLFQHFNFKRVCLILFGGKSKDGSQVAFTSHVGNIFREFGVRCKRFFNTHLTAKLGQFDPSTDYLPFVKQDVNQTTFDSMRHFDGFDKQMEINVNKSNENSQNNFEMQNLVMYFCINLPFNIKPYHRVRMIGRDGKRIILFVHQSKSYKIMKNLSIKTRNDYADAFERFQNSSLFERLDGKFQVKPFFERYRTFRLVALASSYGINIFAAATAFTCVFIFLQTLMQNSLLSATFAIGFLMAVEAFKRLTIPHFFKNLLQFGKVNFVKLALIMGLTAISVTLSYMGAKDTVQLFTPSVELTNVDSIRNTYESRIAILEGRLKDVKKSQSWRGKLTPEGQKTYNQISAQIATLEADKLQNANNTIAKNDEKALQHTRKTGVNAHYFGLFTLLLDLSLIGLLFFVEFYDFRSFTEFAKLNNQSHAMITTLEDDLPDDDNDLHDETGVATRSHAFGGDFVQLAMKKARANISAYEAKIRNNDGNLETNRRGIDKWQRKYDELNAMALQS